MIDNTMKTVLVIDDTPSNIDIVKCTLSKCYLVQAAVNGSMALRILEKKKPDLILLDVMMPDMDGYEVCKRIKAKENLKEIPIIFLTGKAEIESEAKDMNLDVVDCIMKPINPPLLMDRVNTYLK